MYTPINDVIFTAAFNGALAGMISSGRMIDDPNQSDYATQVAVAGAFAQSYDTAWNNATTALSVEVWGANNGGISTFESRGISGDSNQLNPNTWTRICLAIIASVNSGLAYYTAQGITNPPWGGGGGGSDLPDTTQIGDLLTVVTPGVPTSATSVAYQPSGGFQISTFIGGGSRELGNAHVSPTFTQTYNETPDSAQLEWVNPPAGSPQVLITPFTSGQILQTFTSVVVANRVYTLRATKGATTKTATTTDAFGYPFLFTVANTGSIVATQGFLDTMRAAHSPQIHQTMQGSYGFLTVGAGQNFAFAYPSALTLTTVRGDNGFFITPGPVGTVVGYVNPYAVTIPMTLVTFGAQNIGSVQFTVT